MAISRRLPYVKIKKGKWTLGVFHHEFVVIEKMRIPVIGILYANFNTLNFKNCYEITYLIQELPCDKNHL
jgi:hypothetical protein